MTNSHNKILGRYLRILSTLLALRPFLGRHDARRRGSALASRSYSPECVEGEFSEVQLQLAERRSVTKVMSSSCSQPSPVKERSSSIRKPTSDPSSAECSATSLLSRGKPNI